METGRGDKNDGGCSVNGRKLGNSPRRFFRRESCLNYPYYLCINKILLMRVEFIIRLRLLPFCSSKNEDFFLFPKTKIHSHL